MKKLLGVAILVVCLAFTGLGESITPEDLFARADAVRYTPEELAIYEEIIKLYPGTEYEAKALLRSLELLTPTYVAVDTFPLFGLLHYDLKDTPFYLSVGELGFKTYQAAPILDYEQRARRLYDNYRDLLEIQNHHIWPLLYRAGLRDEAYPYLLKALEDIPNPYNINSLYCVLDYMLEEGRIEEGLALCDDFASRIEPPLTDLVPYVYFLKAALYLKADMVDEARLTARTVEERFVQDALFDVYGIKKYLPWFLPEEQTSSVKVGVFVNGAPLGDVTVVLKPYKDQSPLVSPFAEVRITEEDGYTSTFLRSPDSYTVEVRLTPKQAALFNGGENTVVVRSQNSDTVKTRLEREVFPRENAVGLGSSYLVLEPGEEVFVEFFVSVSRPLEVRADKTVYDVDDPVTLSWAEVPDASFYRVEFATEDRSWSADVKTNRIILNENLVEELSKYNSVWYAGFDRDIFKTPGNVLGVWRGSDWLSVTVTSHGLQAPLDLPQYTSSILFPYYSEGMEQKSQSAVVLTVNKDSLEPWEQELLSQPLDEAYDYFYKTFSKSEIESSTKLKRTDLNLRSAYNTLTMNVYLGDQVESKRREAIELIREGRYVEASQIYVKLLRSKDEKVYLDACLCDIANGMYMFLSNESYKILNKDPDFHIVFSFDFHDDLELERTVLQQFARTLLAEDFDKANQMLAEFDEGSVIHGKMSALIRLTNKYSIFED